MRGLNYLSRVTPSTKAVAVDVLGFLQRRGTPLPDHPSERQPVIWGYDGNASNTEHHSGNALDFMVQEHRVVGNVIADYLWANRRRLGVRWIIWQQRIRNPEVSGGQWRGMADRGSTTNNHRDHVHVMLDGKSTGVQSTPATPATSTTLPAPRFPLPRGAYFGPRSGPAASVSGYYSHRDDLRRWQKQMARRGWRITPDGLYGGQTNSVARAFQAEHGLAVDGLIGARTWRAAWTSRII